MRSWFHHHIWTHLLLIIGCILSFYNNNIVLFLLSLITTTLSIFYHRNHEREGVLKKSESFSAKILFMYGIYLLSQTNNNLILFIGILLKIIIFLTYAITNMNKKIYDKYHSLIHILGGILLILFNIC